MLLGYFCFLSSSVFEKIVTARDSQTLSLLQSEVWF
jgi:hypothetical protein